MHSGTVPGSLCPVPMDHLARGDGDVETSLTAESPEVERMNAATVALNAAEARLVRDLPASSPRRAAELADCVAVARVEFGKALEALRAAL